MSRSMLLVVRAPLVAEDQVGIGRAGQHVGTRVPDDRVSPEPALDHVGAIAAMQLVVAMAPIYPVFAVSPDDHVTQVGSAVAAEQPVVAVAPLIVSVPRPP
ncbi:hypothetical protein GCM10011392_10860 [Wenxinia marina]|nr:hypothetical protein GCM10011392_10860 [Wenxinia marina]